MVVQAVEKPSSKPSSRAPFTEAHVIICEGDQRSGKTNTATGRVVDAYHNDCVRIFCEDVLHIKCEVKSYDRKNRIARVKQNGSTKLLRIPKSYKLRSPMRIFANYHLYGIPFTYCPSFAHILDWLKRGFLVNCWLIVDEAYVGMSARACMQALGRELANQYWQFGKMQLDVIIVTPLARIVDWQLRTIPTERIHCTYNERTRRITLTIRKKGIKGEQKFDYDATQYWPNFRTNERIVQ